MYCTNCGASLSTEQTQCEVCGADRPDVRFARLEQALTSAQERVARLSRFVPPIVADGLLHDRERLRGERRDVSVLFVDAVGFTRLSVSLDAESVFNLINDLLSRLVMCVHRYGGLVDKFTGDGLMAVFGAPVAQENDAELAVRAALDMQQAAREFAPVAKAQLGAPLQIRIGIHRGAAVAGVIGTEEQSAYTVIGETVNLAARLESLAQPGHTLVSSSVHTRAEPFIDFAPRQVAEVKGVDQPVEIYEALGLRAQPTPSRGLPGMTGVYLGRAEELSRLHRLTEACVARQRGRLVMITGEAGMGKSRLVSEWISGWPQDTFTVWRGRGLPYAQGVGYGVFRTLLQHALEGYESPDTWEARVSEPFRPFIRRILGLPGWHNQEALWEQLPPERVSQLTMLAMREWLVNESAGHPLVVILDDFHWADDLSRDTLAMLANAVSETPLLLCVVARPDAATQIGAGDLAPELCEHVAVRPLSTDESHALLQSFVDLDGFPPATVQTILTRAEGNPFFIEEFVRMLFEQAALQLHGDRWRLDPSVTLEKLEVPTSLRGLMLARVDRLPEDLRQLLQDAAVIGPQFDLPLLHEVEHRLRHPDNVLPMVERLRDLDLLELQPDVGPQVFAFRHILTQEAVYQSILRNERPELHRVVAESIECLAGDNVLAYAELLAMHYDRARVRDKALEYTLHSGISAQARFANREATEYYSRALQLSQHVGGAELQRWRAAIGLADVQQHIGEYEEAIAFYEAALDERQGLTSAERAEVMLKLGRAWDKLGNLEKAESLLKTAATMVSPGMSEQGPSVEAEIYSALGWLTLRGGDLPGARALLEHAMALANQADHLDVLSSILNRLGAVYLGQGEWEQATQVVQRSLEIRERLGDMLGVARSSNNLGILRRDGGDWAGALQTYQRSLEAMQAIGDTEGVAIAHTNIGNVYIDMGDWEQAESNLRRSYEIAQRIANPYEKAQANMNLGRLYLRKGEWSQAEAYVDTAISLYALVGVNANPNVMDAYWLRAMVSLEQGRIDESNAWRERNLALLKEGTGGEEGTSLEWGRYYQLEGRLSLVQGRVSEALEHLARAKTIFESSRASVETARTAYWCAQVYLRADKLGKARDELTQAQETFVRLGASADLRRTAQFLAGLNKVVA